MARRKRRKRPRLVSRESEQKKEFLKQPEKWHFGSVEGRGNQEMVQGKLVPCCISIQKAKYSFGGVIDLGLLPMGFLRFNHYSSFDIHVIYLRSVGKIRRESTYSHFLSPFSQ